MSNKICFSIVLATISLISLPAFAGSDIQTGSEQITVINGDNNSATSTNIQSVTSSGNGDNNSKVVGRNRQVCDIVGNNNTCSNYNEQRVDNRRYRR